MQESESPYRDKPASIDGDGSDLHQIEDLIDQASDAIDEANGMRELRPPHVRPFELDNLTTNTSPEQHQNTDTQNIDVLGEVELDLRIELGKTHMTLQEVLQLRSGSVVALDALAGDPVNVYVNNRIVARGEIVVMDNNFCVRVTELVGAQ